MTEQQLKYYLSSPRFNVYLAKTNNDFDKAYRLYKVNIELSEAFYPILSVLEVSLRNAVNETLKLHFNDPYWFKIVYLLSSCHLFRMRHRNLQHNTKLLLQTE